MSVFCTCQFQACGAVAGDLSGRATVLLVVDSCATASADVAQASAVQPSFSICRFGNYSGCFN